jgi:hypothetical protein
VEDIRFLTLEEVELLHTEDLEMYDLTMDIANHRTGKVGASDWIRERLAPIT